MRQDYKAYLVAQKPNAHGSFVMGRDVLQRLLASDMVNVPVERVLEAGKAQLAKDRAVYLATEKLVDPEDIRPPRRAKSKPIIPMRRI